MKYMISQNFQEILTHSEYTGLYQIIALILCILFFMILMIMVLIRPKTYYKEVEELPINAD